MLTGQAKKDYQREYMRRRRAGLTKPVRPVTVEGIAVFGGRSERPDLVIQEEVRPMLDPVQPKKEVKCH